jgi:hypothetical protein
MDFFDKLKASVGVGGATISMEAACGYSGGRVS